MAENKIIILDPGHGGDDPGATNDKIHESWLNLKYAALIAEFITRNNFGIIPVMTRYYDTTIDISKRIPPMLQFNPLCVVAIHMNSAENKEAHGFELVYSPRAGEQAYKLGGLIKSTISKMPMTLGDKPYALTIRNDFVRKVRVLDDCAKYVIPAVLVECGFICNDKELDVLIEPRIQARYAQAIALGIAAFVNGGGK